MKILFKYTTRSRRSNFLRGIDSIVNNLHDNENYHILISVDKDDASMFPLPVLDCKHTYVVGESKSKVDAINRDINEYSLFEDWDILVNMSDDVVFIEKGFDTKIRFMFEGESERDLNQVLHFPDGNRNDLLTVSIMGREYYNRDNYIYNPEYKSLYCDNEAMEVAKQRGCYNFVDKQIFEHLHPAYGKAIFDVQYAKTESYGSLDCQTFIRRQANGFT